MTGKRIFDIVAAGMAMLVLAPVIALAAVAVALVLGRPVLFRQCRPGLHGRPFTLVKLRTMSDVCDVDGFPLPDAERLGPLGRFLRRSSLDELPELWNVLHGDMSLVGPRPLLLEYLPRYTRAQRRRHEVRPGLTGWAQVHGRNDVPWVRRFELDVWYVEHQSLPLDLKILWLTLWQILRRKGISQPGHPTMEPFHG